MNLKKKLQCSDQRSQTFQMMTKNMECVQSEFDRSNCKKEFGQRQNPSLDFKIKISSVNKKG